jgi:hypothetical protein
MIGFLLFANVAGIVSKYGFGHDSVYGLVNLFDFDKEMNLPTLYSSIQLIVACLLLSIIGAKHRLNGENYVLWIALAVIFLFLAVDETALIHEVIGVRISKAFEPTGLFYYAWVIPYGIAVLVFVITFSKFLFALPKETKWRFIASGAIYVTGAIGFEMLSGISDQSYGVNSVFYSMFYTCEELLEMVGIALFIYALLAYISNEFQYLRATFTE